MIEIFKNGRLVSKSVNLRGITRYASKHAVITVDATWQLDGTGMLQVQFEDGAYVKTDFADGKVMLAWVRARRYWPIPTTINYP